MMLDTRDQIKVKKKQLEKCQGKTYHRIEKKIIAREHKGQSGKSFIKKLPSLRNLLGAAAEPEEGYSMLGNERATVRCQKQ